MYLEGLGFGSIGRILKISHGTIFNWVKKWGGEVELPVSDGPVEIVEPAFAGRQAWRDAHLCWLKKNYCWVWIAVDRFGKRHIDFLCGDRSTKTGRKLWEKIKNMKINGFCSDYWKSYCEFIPDHKHMQSKAETFTVEGYNSRIRHYLARFRRKTKCYSKAEHIIEKSLKLLMLKLNNSLPILF